MRGAANPIDVLEAAYQLDGADREWLTRVGEAVRPLIDSGHGVTAYFFDLAVPATRWFANAVLFDVSSEEVRLAAQLNMNTGEIARELHVQPTPLEAAIAAGRAAGLGDIRDSPPVAEHFRRHGIRDYLAFRTIEPGGKGIVMTAGQGRERNVDWRTKRLWARVSAHVAAARRLRELIASSAVPAHEAVLSPSGRVDHAQGQARDARDTLREAVLRREYARRRKRRDDPELATEAWTALVSGRWSLVDQFERGGRRYIVARRNEHQLPDPRALTSRERTIAHLAALGKPNKLIAYELGLAESTVGNHLAAAMRKLGARSRVDLIRLVAHIAKAESNEGHGTL